MYQYLRYISKVSSPTLHTWHRALVRFCFISPDVSVRRGAAVAWRSRSRELRNGNGSDQNNISQFEKNMTKNAVRLSGEFGVVLGNRQQHARSERERDTGMSGGTPD